jgi:hypothetical protein
MPDDDQLLARAGANPDAVYSLSYLDFDLIDTEHGQPPRLTCGSYLLRVADPGRPVVHVTNNGQAGLLASSFTAVLQLVAGLPSWHDCLEFAADGHHDEMCRAVARYGPETVADHPGIAEHQAIVGRELGLDLPPADELVARRCASATSTDPGFTLVTEDDDTYDSLFNTLQLA